jgi:hypothetical protein
MPYKRRLEIENGRLLPTHSLGGELMEDMLSAGRYCYCCTGQFFRYRRSSMLQRKMRVAAGKYRWIKKSRPKMWRRLTTHPTKNTAGPAAAEARR